MQCVAVYLFVEHGFAFLASFILQLSEFALKVRPNAIIRKNLFGEIALSF